MKKVIFAAALLTSLPTFAGANDLLCQRFAEQTIELASSKNLDAMSTKMNMVMGFALGTFLMATKQELRSYDDEQFDQFLTEIYVECYNSPEKPAFEVALAAAKKLVAEPAKSSPYQEISLIDLKLDADKMSGKLIEVRGTIHIMGDMASLNDGVMDTTPIFVDFKKLPREQRKQLLERCDFACTGTIQGKIGPVMFAAGVLAENINLD